MCSRLTFFKMFRKNDTRTFENHHLNRHKMRWLRCLKLSARERERERRKCVGSPGVHTMAVDLRLWLDGHSLRPLLSPPRSFWERVNVAAISEWNEPGVYSMRDVRRRECETGNRHDNGKRVMNGTSGT